MSRHVMAAFMLVLAALLAVPATAQQPVEVTFWYSHSNPVDVAAIEEIISGFNASHPNIVVKGVQVPGSETDATRLMTAVRGGIGPDVYLLDRFTVAQRAQAGLLTDLTGLIEASGTTVEQFAAQYLDWAWEETLYNGKVYALPWDADVRALYYRKDLLRAAGFDPNEFDRMKPILVYTPVWSFSFSAKATSLSRSGVTGPFAPASSRDGTTPGASPSAASSTIRQPER